MLILLQVHLLFYRIHGIDREWGLGDEDPKIFNPVKLNTTQVSLRELCFTTSGSKLIEH